MAVASLPRTVRSVVAAASLTQYRAVTGSGALPAAGAAVLGFAMTSGAAGERVPVVHRGTAVAEAGGAVALGALLEVDVQGRVITRSTGVPVARAITAAASAGDQLEVAVIAA